MVGRGSFPQPPGIVSWEVFEDRYREAARAASYSSQYLAQLFDYAKPLYFRGFPVIFDIQHLCALVGYTREYVLGAAYASERFYRSFTVPKRSGDVRTIDEPLPSLKEIQRWILDRILYKAPVSRYAKGFVPGRSIKENARFHRNQPVVLSLDIADFFPSIRRTRVYGLFRSLGYAVDVANVLARICTKDDRLPQGAPTSPTISNLIAARIDRRLAGYAKAHKARYTRYADDITFSGDLRAGHFVRVTRQVLAGEGWKLNEGKTRLMQRHQRQEVTGVVVNQRLRANREIRHRLRQATYFVDEYGLEAHMQRIGERRAGYRRHLLGLTEFILFLDPADPDALRARDLLREPPNGSAGEERA